jgi:hypothetical protein
MIGETEPTPRLKDPSNLLKALLLVGPRAMHLMTLARALNVSVETLLAELQGEASAQKPRRRRKGK